MKRGNYGSPKIIYLPEGLNTVFKPPTSLDFLQIAPQKRRLIALSESGF
jgi:hypothetical protein